MNTIGMSSNVVELRRIPSEPCPKCHEPMQAGRSESTPRMVTHFHCCMNPKCPISDAAVSIPRTIFVTPR
jgi:hypothetical protein